MRLRIVGNNPHAGGSECIVFGHLDSKSNQFTPVSREPRDLSGRKAGISFQGGWEVSDMRFGAGLAKASALVGRTIGQDSCTTSGRVVLVSHRWSGVIQVNDIGRKYTVDLYSQETRLVLLDIVNEFMVDITDLATRKTAS